MLVVPEVLELALRGSWMDRIGEGQSTEYEAGLNVYIPTPTGSLGHHTKLQVAYAYAPPSERAVAPHTVTLQVQASF